MLYSIVIVLAILALHLYYVMGYNKLFDRVTLLEKEAEVEQDAMDHVFAMMDVVFERMQPVKKAKKGLTGKK